MAGAAGAGGTIAYAVHCDPGGAGTLELSGAAVSYRPTLEGVAPWSAAVRLLQDVRVAKAAPKMKLRLPQAAVVGAVAGSAALQVVLKFNSVDERDAFASAATTQKRATTVAEVDVVGVPTLTADDAKKANLLAENADLRHLHRVVVIEKQWVTEDAFWAQRRHLLEGDPALAMRSAHFSRELLAERTVSDGNVYRLNKQLIHDIFSEYPAVEKAYRSHVIAGSMEETEFWSQFLTSSYFRPREARGAARAERQNIFDGLLSASNTAPAAAAAPSAASQPAPSQSRLTALDAPLALQGGGYGTRRPTEWLASAATMPVADEQMVSAGEEIGRRFSRHSVLVLQTANGDAPVAATSTTTASAPPLQGAGAACDVEVDPEADRDTQDVSAATAPRGMDPAPAAAADANGEPPAKRVRRRMLDPRPVHKVRRVWKAEDKAKPSAPVILDPQGLSPGIAATQGLPVADWLLTEHRRAEKAAKAAGGTDVLLYAIADPAFVQTRRVVLEILTQFWRHVVDAASREQLLKHIVSLYDDLGAAATKHRSETTLAAGYRQLQDLLNRALAAHAPAAGGGWQMKT